jgi:hypothetical protein
MSANQYNRISTREDNKDANAIKSNNTKRKREVKKTQQRIAPEPQHIGGQVIMSIRDWIISRQRKSKENPERIYVLTSHIKNLPGYKERYKDLFKKHGGVQNFVRKYGGNIINIGTNVRNKPIIYV